MTAIHVNTSALEPNEANINRFWGHDCYAVSAQSETGAERLLGQYADKYSAVAFALAFLSEAEGGVLNIDWNLSQ